jgi:nucleotide-binding universal stress UspA family protein
VVEVGVRDDDAAQLGGWHREGVPVAPAQLATALEEPGVETEVRLVHGQPARVVVEASSEADLLVITRRPHLLPYGHLGGTGRAILRETRCPTVVLPPAAERVELSVERGMDDEESDRLESHGRATYSRG